MRATLIAVLAIPALLFALTPAVSEDVQPTDAAAASASKTDVSEELWLPPGFKPRKRGKFVVYCRKESVVGTRFPTEKCYDEDGIRQLVQSLREEREKVDQMRRICGSMEACGGGG